MDGGVVEKIPFGQTGGQSVKLKAEGERVIQG